MTKDPIIFSDVLFRVAGEPIDTVEKLQANILFSKCEKIWKNERMLYKLAVVISDNLFRQIECIEEATVQRKMQNIRRDIFNRRQIKQKDLDFINPMLSIKSTELIYSYVKLLKTVNNAKAKFEQLYQKEFERNQRLLKRFLQNKKLISGLTFSSLDLLAEVMKNRRNARSDLKMALTSLKYMTRMCCKTSPFSTFTHVGTAGLVNSKKLDPIIIQQHDTYFSSKVKINNLIYLRIKKLLFSIPSFYREITIIANPTIKQNPNLFKYFFNKGHNEVYQTINTSEFLITVYSKLKSSKVNYNFKDICTWGIKITGLPEASIYNYFNQLVESGFFEFQIGISGNDLNWTRKLMILLQESQFKHCHYLRIVEKNLLCLTNFVIDLESKHNSGRIQTLNKAETVVKEIISVLSQQIRIEQADAKKSLKGTRLEPDQTEALRESEDEKLFLKKEIFFYEDTSSHLKLNLSKKPLQTAVNIINGHLTSTERFSFYEGRVSLLKSFFEDNYSLDQTLSLVEFFEDFFKSSVYQASEEKAHGPVNKSNVNYRSALKLEIDHQLYKPLSVGKEIEDTLVMESITQKGIISSYGAFMQPFWDKQDQTIKYVVNESFDGFGRTYSRFLHILDLDVLTYLRKANKRLNTSWVEFIENTDATHFNANIHPALFDKELKVPGGNNMVTERNQIPLEKIFVRFDQVDKTLKLYNSLNGKEVFIIDCGFQGSIGRAKIYQYANYFNRFQLRSILSLVASHEKMVKVTDFGDDYKNIKSNIVFRPRIVSGNCIFKRKSWQVPREELPMRLKGMTDAEYFSTINIWRKNLSIPEDAFFLIQRRHETAENTSKSDDYKPQYINFKTPILIFLFERSLKKVKSNLIIEEMLPAPSELMKVESNRYVTEFSTQWYNYE